MHKAVWRDAQQSLLHIRPPIAWFKAPVSSDVDVVTREKDRKDSDDPTRNIATEMSPLRCRCCEVVVVVDIWCQVMVDGVDQVGRAERGAVEGLRPKRLLASCTPKEGNARNGVKMETSTVRGGVTAVRQRHGDGG
eukprot:6491407-Amphidinium_carterae.5